MTVASLPRREPPAMPAWPGDGVGLIAAWAHELLGDADGAAAEALAARRADRSDTGVPEPIDRLSRLFGLTPFDEDLLLLVFAAGRDPTLDRRLAARSQPPGGPGQVTTRLALALLAGDDPQRVARGWTRLSANAPLRRFALLRLPDDSADAASSLLIDERVARFIAGEDELDARLRTGLRPVIGGPLSARHAADVGTVLRAISADARPAALILGARGSGRRALACAVAAELGIAVAALRPESVPVDPTARCGYLALLSREAIIARFAVVIDLDPGTEDAARAARSLAEDMLAAYDAPLLLIAAERPAFAPELTGVRLAALDAADRSLLWQRVLTDATAAEIAAAADRFVLGPADIAAVAMRVASGEEGALWAECRATAAAALGAHAERIVPRYAPADLVLPDAVVADLAAIADQLRHRAAVFDRGGFGSKHARGRGVTALFAGPSGTGKTMAAEVIAGELGVDLYRVDLSQVVSKYIGETEKNLGRVFDAAEAGGAVLLFDEADALFGKRTEIKDSHDRYANVEISYLLQRMESFGGLAILATNLKNHLDAAFLRRIRFVVDFPMPDGELRRRLWERAFPPQTLTEDLDFDALTRLEVPGGNILVIAINAAYFAAADGRPVGMQHIARAAASEFRKLDREFRPAWGARL